jgi:hypothetical protein
MDVQNAPIPTINPFVLLLVRICNTPPHRTPKTMISTNMPDGKRARDVLKFNSIIKIHNTTIANQRGSVLLSFIVS